MSANNDANPRESDAVDGRLTIIAASWGAAAEAYVEQFQERNDDDDTRMDMSAGRKLVVSLVVSAMSDKESPVVLDVASAGGEPALSMAKEMPHATVHGTDFVPEMVEQIRKRAAEAGVSNLEARVEDGMSLSGFDDNSVDALTCTWGLESMVNHTQAISQFHRVLKPNGVAVLAVWDKDPNSIWVKLFRVVATLQDKGFDLNEMQALGGNEGLEAMKDAGFEDVTVTRKLLPLYVTPTFGYRDLFAYMATGTPVDVALAFMENNGRPNIREEACALFESNILEDIEQGRAPTGPGLPSTKKDSGAGSGDCAVEDSSKPNQQPAFYSPALILQGRKRE